MPANTNLDANPYFDDYNANNNYYQILYKPSVALQARELTQTQTMLQKQIERYGNWAFKNGDIVSGCAVSDIPKFYYTRLADTTSNGTTYDINSLVGSVATDVSSNLSARVVLTYPGLLSNYPDTQVMYLSYINTGTDGSTVFANNAQLNFTLSGNVVATINTFSNVAANTFTSGIGRGVKVTDGIVYLSGYFVKVTNTVIGLVNAYSQYAGNNVVGVVVDEQIVT
jgi:hypothetical protein